MKVAVFEGNDFHRQLTTALEHLAIIGGLVAIAAAGPGPFSLQPGIIHHDQIQARALVAGG